MEAQGECAIHMPTNNTHTHTLSHTQAAFRLVLRDMSQLCREAFLYHCTQINAIVYFQTEDATVLFCLVAGEP